MDVCQLVSTCMCGTRARQRPDRLTHMCSRLRYGVCPRAVNGDVCVCVFPSLDCIVEKKVASQCPIHVVPSSPVRRTGIKNTKMLYLRLLKPITPCPHEQLLELCEKDS